MIRFLKEYFPIIALGLVVVAAVAVFVWFLTEPGRQREKAAEAKAGQIVAEGQAAAGQDAVAIITDNLADSEAIDKDVRDAIEEVRAAPPGDRNRVALRNLCLSDPGNRGQPTCQLLLAPDPR